MIRPKASAGLHKTVRQDSLAWGMGTWGGRHNRQVQACKHNNVQSEAQKETNSKVQVARKLDHSTSLHCRPLQVRGMLDSGSVRHRFPLLIFHISPTYIFNDGPTALYMMKGTETNRARLRHKRVSVTSRKCKLSMRFKN